MAAITPLIEGAPLIQLQEGWRVTVKEVFERKRPNPDTPIGDFVVELKTNQRFRRHIIDDQNSSLNGLVSIYKATIGFVDNPSLVQKVIHYKCLDKSNAKMKLLSSFNVSSFVFTNQLPPKYSNENGKVCVQGADIQITIWARVGIITGVQFVCDGIAFPSNTKEIN